MAEQLNYALQTFPHETFGLLLVSDVLSIYGCYALLTHVQVPISSEFALAFVLSRVLRKFRLPLDLTCAATVMRLWPGAATIHLGQALEHVMRMPKGTTRRPTTLVRRVVRHTSTVLDQYGAAYLVGSRVAGLVVVSVLDQLLCAGLDLTTWLLDDHQALGVDAGRRAADYVGTWAAAVVMSSCVYPLTLVLSGYVAPYVGRVTRRRV